jgi:hypothetical protein
LEGFEEDFAGGVQATNGIEGCGAGLKCNISERGRGKTFQSAGEIFAAELDGGRIDVFGRLGTRSTRSPGM